MTATTINSRLPLISHNNQHNRRTLRSNHRHVVQDNATASKNMAGSKNMKYYSSSSSSTTNAFPTLVPLVTSIITTDAVRDEHDDNSSTVSTTNCFFRDDDAIKQSLSDEHSRNEQSAAATVDTSMRQLPSMFRQRLDTSNNDNDLDDMWTLKRANAVMDTDDEDDNEYYTAANSASSTLPRSLSLYESPSKRQRQQHLHWDEAVNDNLYEPFRLSIGTVSSSSL